MVFDKKFSALKVGQLFCINEMIGGKTPIYKKVNETQGTDYGGTTADFGPDEDVKHDGTEWWPVPYKQPAD